MASPHPPFRQRLARSASALAGGGIRMAVTFLVLAAAGIAAINSVGKPMLAGVLVAGCIAVLSVPARLVNR